MPTPADPIKPRLVLVTGPSGAGRTTAIRALEDMGYEAIDNLPLSLLPRLSWSPTALPCTAQSARSEMPPPHVGPARFEAEVQFPHHGGGDGLGEGDRLQAAAL